MSASSMMIGAATVGFFGRHAASPNGEVGFPHLQAGLGDRRASADRLGAVRQQLLVVELHAVCRLVLDAIPQRLELLAVQDRLPRLDRPALVGVLDLQLAGELAENLLDLRELRGETPPAAATFRP